MDTQMSTRPGYMNTPTRAFRFPSVRRTERWDPKKLNERHQEMIRMAAAGLKHVKIARLLDVTAQSVTQVLNSEMAQDRIREIRDRLDDDLVEGRTDARLEIREAAGEAAEMLRKVMKAEGEFEGVNANLRARTAEGFLDRSGHGKVTKVEGQLNHGYAGEVGIKLILENAAKAGAIRIVSDETAELVSVEGGSIDAPREDSRQQSEAEV